MKKLSILAIYICFWACQPHVNTKDSLIEHIHIERKGGGQIDFSIYPTHKKGVLAVEVSKLNFKDTTIKFTLEKNDTSQAVFSIFEKVIQGNEPLEGNNTPSTLPTGTWVSVFVVGNGKETEITKNEVRDSLLVFERLIRKQLPME